MRKSVNGFRSRVFAVGEHAKSFGHDTTVRTSQFITSDTPSFLRYRLRNRESRVLQLGKPRGEYHRLRSSLTLRAEPAIDIQDCTGHVRSGGTRQEGDPGGDFLWSCKAVQCNAFDQTAQLRLERFDHIRIRESR